MKNFLSAFLGAACGAAGVLTLLAVLLKEPASEPPAAADVATASAAPQELVLRIENPVLHVEGTLRTVLEPDARLAEALGRRSPQSLVAGGVTLAAGRDQSKVAESWGALEPILEDNGGIEHKLGPITYRQLADGTLVYRGEQILDDDGNWVRNGNWQAWHENGARNEDGAYSFGREHGPWEWWYDDGQRMARGSYDAGKRLGHWTFWHPGGELMMNGQYDADGLATGTWTYYHTDGKKASEGEMVADEPEGRWTSWETSGAVNFERSGVYVRGERVAR